MSGSRIPRCAAIFWGVLLLLPVPGQAQQRTEDLPHPKTLEELQKAMKDTIEKNHVPGAGVALIQKGEVLWCGGIGKADLAANREVTCDTEFRVGSISKTFVVLALMKLQEEGKINLYSRLADVAREVPVKNPWEATHPVRIVNLLEHTAGFDDMRPTETYNEHDPPDYPLLKVFQNHPGPQEVRWPPSTRMAYSNPGYGIAGYLVQKISGEPYDQYIQKNILAPLGIARGSFQLTEANKPFLARGYKDNPPQAVPYKHIYLSPAGDMKASPGELAKLVQMFLNRGMIGDVTLLRPESIARMELPETTLAAKSGLRVGYALANYTDMTGGVVTHGHDGGIDGFISTYRYMPEQGWGYVALINSTVSFKALQDLDALSVYFLTKDLPKPQQPAIQVAAADLEKFTGYYEQRSPRNQMIAFLDQLMGSRRVYVEKGKLYEKKMFGPAYVLIPVAPSQFRGEKEPEASTIFFSAEDGAPAMAASGIDGGGYLEKASSAWAYLRLGFLILCMALMASSVLFALVWILRKLFGKMKEVKHLSVRVVPLAATLCFVAAAYSLVTGVGGFASINLKTLSVFLGTMLFAVLGLAGLILVLRAPASEVNKGVRIHSLLVSLACCGVALYLASWHLIGLRLWAP